ncbi:MAG: threonylcarbamoyl-AMP synthase [Alphaproteobacteria bacterium]|nr:threonylcarbamoyl-AMP synthase [Alphaproteobacteria bacterium]
MREHQTMRLEDTDAGIAAAAALLREGRLVAFPTETVYGLGGLATDDGAVAAIYAAKGRPAFNPLIVHVATLDAAKELGEFDAESLALAGAFWPGPLTLVVPAKPGSGLSDLVTAGLSTVALRVPAQPLARRLLAELGAPVAAPSANPSGRLSPTTADHVIDLLGDGRIAAVLDGGPCTVGVESTIVTTYPEPRLLRPGGLPVEPIEACLGTKLAIGPGAGGTVTAPGQLASHYAPTAALRLDVTKAKPGEVLLGFGPVDGTLNLSPSGDLTQAAANLFSMLRELDGSGADVIAVAPIPHTGLGLAINDRLARAAAPRP